MAILRVCGATLACCLGENASQSRLTQMRKLLLGTDSLGYLSGKDSHRPSGRITDRRVNWSLKENDGTGFRETAAKSILRCESPPMELCQGRKVRSVEKSKPLPNLTVLDLFLMMFGCLGMTCTQHQGSTFGRVTRLLRFAFLWELIKYQSA